MCGLLLFGKEGGMRSFSPAKRAMMSLINGRVISNVDLYEALAPSRVYLRSQKVWLHDK